MTWNKLVKDRPTAAVNVGPCVRVALGKGGKQYKLSVLIHVSLLEIIGGPSKTYSIYLGSGEEAHLLRVVQDDKGDFYPTKMGLTKGEDIYRLRLPHIDRLPKEKKISYVCRYEIKGNEMEISLPSWAWMTPPSKRPVQGR